MATIKEQPFLQSYESPQLNRSTTSIHVLRNSFKQNQQIIEDLKQSIEKKKINLKEIQLNINFQLQKQLTNVKKNAVDRTNVRQIFSKNTYRDIPNIKKLEDELQNLRKSISNQKSQIKKMKGQGKDTGTISIQQTGLQYQQNLDQKQKVFCKLEEQKKTLQTHLARVQNELPSKEKQQQLDEWQNKLNLELKELINGIKQKKSELKKMEEQDIRVTEKTRFLSQLVNTNRKSRNGKLQNTGQLDSVLQQLKYIMKEKREVEQERDKQYRNAKKKHDELILAKSKIQQEIRNIDCVITQKNLNDMKDAERKKRQKEMEQLRAQSEKQHQQKMLQRKERIQKLWESRSFRIKEIQQNIEKSKLRNSQEEKIKKPKCQINYPKLKKKIVLNSKENEQPSQQYHNAAQNENYLDEDGDLEIASQQYQYEKENQQNKPEQQQIQQLSVYDSRLNVKLIQLGMEQSEQYSLQLNDSFLGDRAKIKSIQIHHDQSVIIGVQATYLNKQNQEVQGYKVISKIKPKKFQTLLLQVQPKDFITNVKIGKNKNNIIKYMRIQTQKSEGIVWGSYDDNLVYQSQAIDQYQGITLKAKLQSDQNGGPNSLSLSGIAFQIKLTQPLQS